MTIDTAFFHLVCIYTLQASAVVLTFVIVERLVYYALLGLRLNTLGAVMHGSKRSAAARTFKRRDVLTRSIAQYLDAIAEPGMSRTRLEDLSMSQFIKVSSRISARLWLLDTIVTAAPLLGLLGTILGIMDTFNALSAGGISDPGAVSRGIGSALIATAIGIGVALYGLLGHNVLHRIADFLMDGFKRLVLVAESYALRASVAPAVVADVALRAAE